MATGDSKYTLQILSYYGESGLLGVETAPIMGALIDKFDDQYSNTLVLGEGDSYIPGPWLVGGSDPSLNKIPGIGTTALGRPDIAIMNAFGTNASALGNHEFDLGSPVLQAAITTTGTSATSWPGAQFPFITTNLNFAADSSLRGIADATLGGTATNDFAGKEASVIKGKIAPYTVVTKGGEKIGIVGATTYDLLSKTSPNGTVPKDDGIPTTDDLQEVVAYLQAAVDALKAAGVNKIILVDQLDTIERNKALAPLVSGIDVMVAGGGHERLGDANDTAVGFNGHSADFLDTFPIITADKDGKPTLIITTDTEYSYLGRLVVDFNADGEIIVPNLNSNINGAYASTEANLQAAYGSTGTAKQIVASSTIGSQVSAITDAINNVIVSKDGNIFGYTKVYLEGDRAFGRAQEVNLGDISADANLFKARAAFAPGTILVSLKNGGGIRASVGSINEKGEKIPPISSGVKPAGAISQLDVENALRFDNKLMVFDTTPQGLLNILNYAAGLAPGNGGYAQVGGVRFSYDSTKPVGQRVQDVAISDLDGNLLARVADNGVILADAPAKISVVTLSFTANGGDGYPIKTNADNFRYLLANGTLSAPIDEALDFTAVANTPADTLGEQKAFEDFLKAFHDTPEKAYDFADTPATQDQRIQNLSVKATDTVFTSLKQEPPVAGNDNAKTVQNNSINISVATLLANDSTNILNPLTITGLSGSVNGNAVLNNNGTANNAADDFVTFVPNSNFVGDASFDYTLSNGVSTNTAKVTVAVDSNIVGTPVSDSQISLKKIGGIVSTNGAEIAAFDAGSDRLFVVAGSVVETQKIDDKGTITADGSLALGFTPATGTTAIPNSVAVKNGIVAVAYAIQNTATKAQEAGQVSFYRAATGVFLNSVTVGALPDMLTFTPDGTKVLVANEGEPNSYGQADSVDPEGSVSIIDIAGGVGAATVQTASFTSFNSQIDALKAAGVRITAPGATVAQDLEPEYIAVSPDGLTARVTLQENNAIAVLDIASATITSVIPLGVKDHSLPGNALDASDRDLTSSTGTINIRNQPVFGLYQPDAIASFSIDGQVYYITANEGDARDYTGFAEESRVGASGYVLDSVKFPNATSLKQNGNLGRLTVTKATGDTDGDGDIDRIEAFGTRSFSIWDASGKQIFDSGDQLEQITATQVPTLFNSDGAAASFDSRSDNKGPEPEGVAIGVINNRTYAFIGLERVGDVVVYDVTTPTKPQFVQYLNTTEDVGAEGLSFIAASDSPTGKPLLVSTNEVSKTVALFEIEIKPGTVVVDTPPEVQPKLTSYDFTNLPKLGTASNGREISLGGFSGLYFQGFAANGNLKFVTHTDRGPNGDPTGANRPFLLPNFQPEIISFELNRDSGKIDITKRTGLFRADGTTPLTGLPNLQAQANGLAYTDEIGVDLAGNVLPNDPFGADLEGIVVASNGDYWLVDEYRPAIYHFDTNGKLLDRFVPKGTAAATDPDSAPGSFGTEVLPEVYSQRRSNRGFEAVALEGDKLYVFIQSPIDNPDNAGDTDSRASRNLRILEFDTVSKTVTGEYLYLLDSILATGNAKTDKLGDAVALGNGKFALVERDDLSTSASNKLIYQIDLAGATNINDPANFTLPAGKTIEQLTAAELVTAKITPVSKSLIANAAQLGYTGVEKLEGLALVSPNTLALVNDNDFNVAGGNVPSRLGLLELANDLPVTTDLELTQSLDNNNPNLGDQVAFTLTVANKGVVSTNGISVTDQLPSELSFISATPSQGAYDSTTGVWNVGEIAANGSGTLQITAKVNANGTVVNKAEITTQEQADIDSKAGNNLATEDDQAATTLSVTALISTTTNSDTLTAGVTAGFDGTRDIVFTGAGQDNVDIVIAGTSAGNNRIDLGSGNDLIYIADADRVFGSVGDDELDASDAKGYRASGGAGNDIFYLGTSGKALGGDGNDKFFAGTGGGNIISGGAGVDQFWIANGEAPNATNTILDFQVGTDVIGIQGIGANATNVVLTQVGANTSIGFGGQTLAVLNGIQVSSLTPTNSAQFMFA